MNWLLGYHDDIDALELTPKHQTLFYQTAPRRIQEIYKLLEPYNHGSPLTPALEHAILMAQKNWNYSFVLVDDQKGIRINDDPSDLTLFPRSEGDSLGTVYPEFYESSDFDGTAEIEIVLGEDVLEEISHNASGREMETMLTALTTMIVKAQFYHAQRFHAYLPRSKCTCFYTSG